jgi:hypothetical protein
VTQLTLVVLAAGAASRFGRLKQLEPIGPHGAALMDYGIYDAKQAGFGRFVLVVPSGMEERFKTHVVKQFRETLPVTFATQTLDGASLPSSAHQRRRKPWGTGHALLAAGALLHGPFAVCNADDYYGPDAYAMLHTHLCDQPDVAALVGYPLRTTLSQFGGVSRAICRPTTEGHLADLVEVLGVMKSGDVIRGVIEDHKAITLTGDEITSMNLWGLPHRALAMLKRQFDAFLDEQAHDQTAEFLLSHALRAEVLRQGLQVRILTTHEEWLGITYAQDTPAVAHRIVQLTATGHYPKLLWQGLS